MNNLVRTIYMALFVLLTIPALASADNHVRTDYTPLPEEKYFEQTPYLSGGLGIDIRKDMREQLESYNLKLVFANDKGEYLADIDVKIVDEQGRWMLAANSKGPWLYTRLPAGEYTVLANYDQVLRIKKVSVKTDLQQIQNVVW